MKTLTPILSSLLLVSVLAGQAHAAGPVVPVKVDTIRQAPMTSTLNVHGTVFGRNDVSLTAGASGQLTYVAEPGTFLERGQVAARIDMLPLQLQKAEQEALIKRAQITVNFHKKEIDRLKSLAKTDAAAEYQIDMTQNNLDLALSDIELAELKLKQLNDRIERATVKTPFDGIVSERFRQAGGDVNRADNLVKFLDIDNLETRLFVPIKYLAYVKKGLQLTVSSGEFEMDQKTRARVISVIPATEERSQTFEIRARLDLSNGSQWATGQLVEVDVPIVKTTAVTMINRDALIIRRDGIHIVKIDPENKAHRIPVKVGKGQGDLVEVKITDDSLQLNEGDNIAIRGAERLQEGQEVTIQTAS